MSDDVEGYRENYRELIEKYRARKGEKYKIEKDRVEAHQCDGIRNDPNFAERIEELARDLREAPDHLLPAAFFHFLNAKEKRANEAQDRDRLEKEAEGLKSGNRVGSASHADFHKEEVLRLAIEKEWGCEAHHFLAQFSPVDLYTVRDGRLTGFIEVKGSTHRSDRWPDYYLSVPKWANLVSLSHGTCLPVYVMVKFLDCVKGIDVLKIDASRHRIFKKGRPPSIAIPVASMPVTMETEE